MDKRGGAIFLILPFLLAGCFSADSIRVLSSAPAYIDAGVAVGTKVASAVKPISDEQEYYIGRAVAARILSNYRLYENEKVTEYVNLVGNTVALSSARPYLYGGYHFAILDTPEKNAFACPGGIVFITKGMLDVIENEDELAAVLGHEIAHINNYDGVKAIKSSRWTEVFTAAGSAAASQSGAGVAQLANVFKGAIDDVFKTIVVNGYGKSQEYNADENCIIFLADAGYSPAALKDFLNVLIRKGTSSEGGLLKTHPATASRIDKILTSPPPKKIDPSLLNLRTQRFLAYSRTEKVAAVR